MTEMISYCGLLCNECRAFIATQTDDEQLRAKVATQWNKQFGFDLKAEDVNCDGCQTLESFIQYIPHAKKKLEQIRAEVFSGKE